MKKSILAASAALILGSTSTAFSQTPPAEGTLKRAQALFKKVDLDGDGSLSAREAGRSQIPSRDFVTHDTDRDRNLSEEEFVLFYRQLLIKASKQVAPDLEAEAARIQGARRARQADEARKKDAAKKAGSKGADPAVTEKVQGAGDATDAKGDGKGTDGTPVPVVNRTTGTTDPQPAPTAQDPKAQQGADRIAAERERQRRLEAQRTQQERDRLALERNQAVRRKGQDPTAGGGDKNDPAGQSPEERAKAYVVRLVKGGSMTTEQARDFYAVLLAKDQPIREASKVEALRTAHKRARDRVSSLVVKGALSAEEGRALAATMDARAKAILSKSVTPRAPRIERSAGGNAREGAARKALQPAHPKNDKKAVEPGDKAGGKRGEKADGKRGEKADGKPQKAGGDPPRNPGAQKKTEPKQVKGKPGAGKGKGKGKGTGRGNG